MPGGCGASLAAPTWGVWGCWGIKDAAVGGIAENGFPTFRGELLIPCAAFNAAIRTFGAILACSSS